MPLALRRLGAPGGRIQVLGESMRMGRDPAHEVVVADPRVRPSHARMRQLKGEWVVAAEGDAPLSVNGREVPFFALRPGDRIELGGARAPGAPAFVLEDALAGAFVPPGVSRLAAWLAQPTLARGPEIGPADYGLSPEALATPRVEATGRLPEGGGSCRIEVGPALASALECERALEAAVSLAGAPHPALAHVFDAGALRTPEGPRPWIVVHAAEGRSAAELLAGPPLSLGAWLRGLAQAARGLAWLHRRGCLLRHVSAGRFHLTPGGAALLTTSLDARAWRHGLPPRAAAGGLDGFVAPEERVEGGTALTAAVDVFGLCALGAALLLGARAGTVGGPKVEELPARWLAELAGHVPPDLEQLLREGLATLPAQRPNAADLARRLEGFTQLWGMPSA